ncbi:TonB-dependent siderophore receptor [Mesorhizobium sp. NPDC059054]|uniref:TonB-dependent siderophore receptor n=1 Tax=Mesorhizobium sp. NPDC059054 TaxID=3346711 RepID=UPI0036A0800A
MGVTAYPVGRAWWGTYRSRLLRDSILAFGAMLALPLPANAQDATEPTQLEKITLEGESARGPDKGIVVKQSVSASKTNTPLKETPQAISIVTRDQMKAQGVDSVADALRYTPGVLPDPNGMDVRYDWLYIRGFNTFGTSWLDGLILPGDPTGYATPTIHPFALERVEVIKGPASVLYGRTVPGGLVNLVSKRPQETAHREASIKTSAFGGIEGAIDATGPLTPDGEWLYRFTGLAKNMHTQIDMERDRKILLAPSLTWNPSTDTSLTLYGYYQRDRDIFSPRFYPAIGTLLPNPAGQIPRDVFLADPNANQFNRDFFAAGYEFSHRFSETWTVRQNLRYARAEQDMFLALVNPAFAYTPGAPSSQLNRVTGVSNDKLSTFAVDTQAEAVFDTGALNHTVLFGLDYIHSVTDTNFGNTGAGVSVPPLDFLNPIYGLPIPNAPIQRSGLQKQDQIGFYAQDQIRYDRWVGTFGLRYDRSNIESTNRMLAGARPVETDDSRLTWRAGVTYLFDNGLAPYASYTTSFLPTLGTDKSNNPFRAQTAQQFEVGVKYEPVGARGMVGLSVFDLTLENALTPDPTDTRFSVQAGKQRVRGVELEAKVELTPELDVLGAYAYSHSEVLRSNRAVELGREMLRLPEHQASLWAIYRPSYMPGLALSAGVRAMSSYQTDSTYLAQLRIPARTLVDIGAEYDFGAVDKTFEGTKLQVNVSNLFDKKYVSHCLNLTGGSCNYGAGRTITAGINYTW